MFDSRSDFEVITSTISPDNFNSTDNENNSFDNRSDDKGPEPEGIEVGQVNGRTYAFVGLERIGGVMVYDITNPNSPNFNNYINTRDFAGNPETGTAGDLAPEGLKFISAANSPNGKPLLVVSNEVSGTVTTFEVENITSSTLKGTDDNDAFGGGDSQELLFGLDGDDYPRRLMEGMTAYLAATGTT